ncbi:pilus assembly FimT family protein [Zestomonas carbonaria]|uniref:Prepilin-type N-terminal cleavage/methylation domain-containing protein n=1 Tax=Zestomonas carbonaria TaxID=2762745 RepID=A0A7U7ENC3_9GAMM|nr:prepilin-type N-terminal cleavage/methylation domain-containing protein [Pseudomonas carbonaria]CAD5108228.1 hypothetical protein PSEWESI4_02513 [Pseudomonas carbonaria]
MKRHAGFSLVELMIVVTLLGVLLMVAAPFTAAWSDSAQVRDAEGLLNQGIGRAKAAALRNRHGMIDDQPSALLCLDGDKMLSLHEAAGTGSPASCDAPRQWSAQLPQRVAVQSGGSDFACLGFDARAMPIDLGGCADNQTLALSAGSEHVSVTFH